MLFITLLCLRPALMNERKLEVTETQLRIHQNNVRLLEK